MASRTEILRYLARLDCPAARDAVVSQAEREGAPPEVVRALRALPPVDYADTAEVARCAALDPAPEGDPARRAERGDRRRHLRVAQHLRSI
ncbi:DUF2795 domain-containing protein [Micromonospora antibiotica]|uniref:DUF2795 domain-containing protein n=1 Tax=Micromonospora antibiotica TaxID=2807623 RepID=A0ABS3V543_9ACTN|nr:DUF2795 domain-containing protein [Micromonospora antibiotica]MBO4160730.1 DUF2795 domain-containing protein [Micromonospora antibiotica]